MNETEAKMTDKTKTTLSLILGVIGLTLLFGGLICDILTSKGLLNDWANVAMIVGWPIITFAEYFRPLTSKKDMEQEGCSLFFLLAGMISLSIPNVFQIEHFTTPIIIILIIAAILLIPACLMSYMKWRRVRKQLEEGDDEKK